MMLNWYIVTTNTNIYHFSMIDNNFVIESQNCITYLAALLAPIKG